MKWLIVRVDSKGNLLTVRKSDWFPRFSEGETAEEAVENMFGGEVLRPASLRYWLAIPVVDAVLFRAQPRREYDLVSTPFNPECLRHD